MRFWTAATTAAYKDLSKDMPINSNSNSIGKNSKETKPQYFLVLLLVGGGFYGILGCTLGGFGF